MEKMTFVDLSDFEFELCKVRDTIIAVDLALEGSNLKMSKALAVPTERLMALCESLHEIIEKEEGAGEDEREENN